MKRERVSQYLSMFARCLMIVGLVMSAWPVKKSLEAAIALGICLLIIWTITFDLERWDLK